MPLDMSGVTSTDRLTQTTQIDAVYADASEKDVTMDDFLNLMVAQLKNQDFMNPVDDTQYMAQLAQFTTLQQMQEMSYNSKSTFLTSLIGKNVVAAKLNVNGELDRTEGTVDKVSFVDNKFMFYIGSQGFTMDQIMQVTETTEAKNEGQGDANGSDSVS
ncbi:MAG: flagellar hook capping protein [Candidatus Ruminococcus intestinipullorum]|nr:flagellar hook capping protein [Candidatus Ruminococcus intestinipullorum]